MGDFNNLQKKSVLGAGGFGVVWLVEQRSGPCGCFAAKGDSTMALKEISKGLVVRERVQAAVQNERKVMAIMAGNPLFIHLYGTYKDAQNIYFIMEMAPMDILSIYAANKLFGKSHHA